MKSSYTDFGLYDSKKRPDTDFGFDDGEKRSNTDFGLDDTEKNVPTLTSDYMTVKTFHH